MTVLKPISAVVFLAALIMMPGQAQARRYHYSHGYGLPYAISYSHNYGPGPVPGSFAYYDGPSTNSCRYGSAAYRAQGGRFPCF